MSRPVDVTAQLDLSPEILAAAFWEMDSSEQVRFFAALDDAAGYVLCQQMAFVVDDIRKASDAGDQRAVNAFRTMLAHASELHETMTDMRVNEARRDIARICGKARSAA